jgi:hypothetical protein
LAVISPQKFDSNTVTPLSTFSYLLIELSLWSKVKIEEE